jgi:nitroimidazol reductase NimA-like FMN-containing flavoprotein (pyridoxamine 5'-phosphate oxidase superfamily)
VNLANNQWFFREIHAIDKGHSLEEEPQVRRRKGWTDMSQTDTTGRNFMETMPMNPRRKDRAISNQDALDLLLAGEYGVLSTVSPDGQPYGVPVSFCVIEEAIYFHCALEGRKLDHIASNNSVSFCVVGKTEVLPEKFGTKYESAIVSGVATEVFDPEKQGALTGLIGKYSAAHQEEGMKYIETSAARTRVFKISIRSITGKARR